MPVQIKLPIISEEDFSQIIHNSIRSCIQNYWGFPVNDLQDTVSFSRLQFINLSEVLVCRLRSYDYNYNDHKDKDLDVALQRQHNIHHPRTSVDSTEFSFPFIYHHALGDGRFSFAFLSDFRQGFKHTEFILYCKYLTSKPTSYIYLRWMYRGFLLLQTGGCSK